MYVKYSTVLRNMCCDICHHRFCSHTTIQSVSNWGALFVCAECGHYTYSVLYKHVKPFNNMVKLILISELDIACECSVKVARLTVAQEE